MSDHTRPLRVCHVMSADLWAGAEVQVATVAAHLVAQRVELSAVLFNEGRLAERLRSIGVEVDVLDERRHTSVALLVRLARSLRQRRVDVVHTHRNKDCVIGALAAKLAQVPHVVRTIHGMPEPMSGWDRAKYALYEVLDRTVLWCVVDRIITVSHNMAAALTASGHRPNSLITIHNGLELERVKVCNTAASVRRGLGIDEQALLIGTAGRLCAVKAQDLLLRAAPAILRERPDARFLIAGDGPLGETLRALAVHLGVAEACIFPGAVGNVHDAIAAMDVFVLPSLHEGVPMALLEAMALERPVVATAVGGVPEVVTNGLDGLLIEAGDDRALANACLTLARDHRLGAALGAMARRTVETKFTAEANGGAVLDTYRSLARGAGRAPAIGTLCRQLLWGFGQLACERVRYTVDSVAERSRMARLRRRPRVLRAVLRSARRILILCQGNIIRSPFAASLVAKHLGEECQVAVASAGVAATPGRPPHPVALELATLRSVDLRAHAASPVSAESVAASDAIFAMDVPQLVWMRRHFPEARGRTFLLTCLAPETDLEIRDPYAGSQAQFQECFDHIARAVQPLVSELRQARSLA
jgi:glycosyltransferase involved in cell wall biosynthesis/protein-tyrosine-phosphatase